MKPFLAFLCLVLLANPSPAAKPALPPAPQPVAVSCSMPIVTYDWDFSVSNQGFYVAACDEGGTSTWQWGYTTIIPGALDRLWGTMLDYDYPEDAGERLYSPTFMVTSQACYVEVYHFFETEYGYDGCNVGVIGTDSEILTPIGGYTTSWISPSVDYYAYCVDGEPGWTGMDATWRVDCFDLSAYVGTYVSLVFDFGSDSSVQERGWYLSRVRVGGSSTLKPCCSFETGACEMMTQETCLAWPGEWHPEASGCIPGLCPQPIPDGHLSISSLFNPEPWNNWIDGRPGSILHAEVHPGVVSGGISHVQFSLSRDNGATWVVFHDDADGSEPALNTYGPAGYPHGDGWSGDVPVPTGSYTTLRVKALVYGSGGDMRVLAGTVVPDFQPPSMGAVSLQDWTVSDRDTMGVECDPGGSYIVRIVGYDQRIDWDYVKGIPGINQHIVSVDHCSPTAAAQCLRYFQNEGDHAVTGGLSDHDLVGLLGETMHTTSGIGTSVANWTGGLTEWIQDHGDGYTVKRYLHYTRFGDLIFEQADWTRMRGALERCSDVLLGLFWEGGSGGHSVTLNAINNTFLSNGRVLLGLKDPWTGMTSTGELEPHSGYVYNVGGAGGGNTAYIGVTMIVAPKEPTIAGLGPGSPVFDGLPPGPPYIIPMPVIGSGLHALHFVLINEMGHAYRITRLAIRGSATEAPDHDLALPIAYDLSPASPNPSRAGVEMTYSLPAWTEIHLAVYDVSGRLVRFLADGETGPGVHQIAWDGQDAQGRPVAPGIYYVKMTAPTYEKVRSVTIVR